MSCLRIGSMVVSREYFQGDSFVWLCCVVLFCFF